MKHYFLKTTALTVSHYSIQTRAFMIAKKQLEIGGNKPCQLKFWILKPLAGNDVKTDGRQYHLAPEIQADIEETNCYFNKMKDEDFLGFSNDPTDSHWNLEKNLNPNHDVFFQNFPDQRFHKLAKRSDE